MKWVRNTELADYLVYGWHVVVIAGPPPENHDPSLVLIERR